MAQAKKAKKAKKGPSVKLVTYYTAQGEVTRRVRGGAREAVNRAPRGTTQIVVAGTRTVTRKVMGSKLSKLAHRFQPFGWQDNKVCFADASRQSKKPICVKVSKSVLRARMGIMPKARKSRAALPALGTTTDLDITL